MNLSNFVSNAFSTRRFVVALTQLELYVFNVTDAEEEQSPWCSLPGETFDFVLFGFGQLQKYRSYHLS